VEQGVVLDGLEAGVLVVVESEADELGADEIGVDEEGADELDEAREVVDGMDLELVADDSKE
jgi:hypothetical protein